MQNQHAFAFLLFLLAVPALSSTAMATTDSGESSSLIRLSGDGTKALTLRCGMQGESGFVEVIAPPNKVLKRIALESFEFESEDPFSGPCAEQPAAAAKLLLGDGAPALLRSALLPYGFTLTPVGTPDSPDRSRVAFIAEKKDKGGLYLVEGKTRKVLHSWTLDFGGMSMSHQGVAVAWSPDGRTLVAHGSYQSGSEDGDCEWSPVLFMVRFPGPSKAPLDRRKVAEEFNSQGFRYYKKAQQMDSMDSPGEWYELAVKRDPTYEAALYNSACTFALDGKLGEALERLSALRALGTDKAMKSIHKARKDTDFKQYWGNPTFLEATK